MTREALREGAIAIGGIAGFLVLIMGPALAVDYAGTKHCREIMYAGLSPADSAEYERIGYCAPILVGAWKDLHREFMKTPKRQAPAPAPAPEPLERFDRDGERITVIAGPLKGWTGTVARRRMGDDGAFVAMDGDTPIPDECGPHRDRRVLLYPEQCAKA